MYRISGSVGQGGRNSYDDVLLVQKMLNKNLPLMSGVSKVPEDGNLDTSTQEAIVAFQKQVVRLANPDGRIDPNGRTWKILTGEQPHGGSTAFVQLPGEGEGYYLYTTRDKQFGTPATIQSIKDLGINLKPHGIEIAVGDISFANGAKMPPHDSHRRGIDVDIRPQRTDGARSRVAIDEAAYSRERTKKVVEILRDDPNLKSILFNDGEIPGVKYYKGHHNHLHIRFKA
jgi:peptidoglycan hydrolase-like protein with peptidoglycan-binding domain